MAIVSIIVQYDSAGTTIDYLTVAAVLLVMIVVAIAIDAVETKNINPPDLGLRLAEASPDTTLPRMPPRRRSAGTPELR